MLPESLNNIIRTRRSIYPKQYSERPIEQAVLQEILENANWAPTHKKTEPWRFIVFEGANRQHLSDYLGNYYLANTPAEKQSEIKLKNIRIKPVQASIVIAICMQRDPEERLPEWEEVAAVASAVQNMWLSCTAYGIGAYWSSPSSIIKAGEFLQLASGERCLGLFYMGYFDGQAPPVDRKPVGEKVRSWTPATK
ncbi:MAG: nitroreductase [Saprospiraceae bacterium]|nr:nitroreductase [Saprospiraceae bacterium]